MMHQKLDAAWTLEKLASACGMSRSASHCALRKWSGDAAGLSHNLENAEGRNVVTEKR